MEKIWIQWRASKSWHYFWKSNNESDHVNYLQFMDKRMVLDHNFKRMFIINGLL